MAEGEQINTEQTRLDKIDKKIDKKVMVKGKDYAEIVIKKVDAIEEKLKSNFGIKEQIVLDSPKFKESKTKAFSDTFAILRGIDEKNIDALTVKLDQKLKDIEKEFIPFSAEEIKITKFKNDLADFNTYMEKRRGLEKSGKFKEAQNLTNEYQSKHVVATETASPIETANYLASKKYQEVKNTLGDSEKINELLHMAQGYVDQANEERKFEQQEGFRVGYMVQGSNRHSEKSAVELPSDLAQSTDRGDKKEIIDLAAIVEINPEKGVRIVMTAACTDATRVELKELGVAEGWVKPAVLRKAISVFAMKFSHCEEGTTRCVTPKKEGKSIETEAQAKALVDEANILKAKVEITTLMDKTSIASKRAIEVFSGNIMSKEGKVSFTPKFLADFENLTIEQKKSGIKMAQDSLLRASIIEATEKAEDPVSKHFHLGRESLQNGDLPGARFRFNQFLDEVSRQQDRPEMKDMIVFAKEQVKTFNIASIKRLQRINDQLSNSKRYEALFKDHANERFLYNFIAKNKANLEFQLQQIEAGTIEAKAQGASLVQRKEQTISATPIVGPDGRAPSMQEKDNSDKLMDAWNSLVYAEFSTGIESDKGKIQDEYLSAARSLRSLGQPDIASEYFEAAMKEDIDRVRGSISAAQKEQMRTKIINENEKKRSTYETTIRKKIWGEIEEFNAKRPPEQRKPLEISTTELTSLVDEAMAEGVEEKMKKAVMHGMEVANDKGELEKGGKKAWSEYESMMDVNDKWYIISDKEAEKIAEQVFINGIIMAISGGVGSLAAASVRAYMIANGIRSGLALGAAGFVAESTGFELANRGIRTTILKEKGLFMPIELAKGIGQSMLMFGSIGVGNKGWSAVSKATGLATEEAIATAGTTEKLLRTGADKSGELTVRASMKKASDNVVEESLGKITGRTIRKGLDWSGQLATEAAIFSATSDNSFIESAGDIIMLRIGGKFVSPITGAMHDAGRKIIEEGAKKGQEKDMSMPVGAIDNPVGEVGETSVKPETSQEALQDQHEQSLHSYQQEYKQRTQKIVDDYRECWSAIEPGEDLNALRKDAESGKITQEQFQIRTAEVHEQTGKAIADLRKLINLNTGELTLEKVYAALAKDYPDIPIKQKRMLIATAGHLLLTFETTRFFENGLLHDNPGATYEQKAQQLKNDMIHQMQLPPLEGKIDYKIINGVLCIRPESQNDYGKFPGNTTSHTSMGIAISQESTHMGIGVIVVRPDQELSPENDVIEHELQHIYKHGSDPHEPEQKDIAAFSRKKAEGKWHMLNEQNEPDRDAMREYFKTVHQTGMGMLKHEALAFLVTKSRSIDQIYGSLTEERGSYDFSNNDVVYLEETGMTEAMKNTSNSDGLVHMYHEESMVAKRIYRKEAQDIISALCTTVKFMQRFSTVEPGEREKAREQRIRAQLRDYLMFIPIGEWKSAMDNLMTKVEKGMSQVEASPPASNTNSPSNPPSPSITDGPQHNAKEIQDRYEQLAKKGFGPYLQMLAANLHFDPNTGKELATTQSRIDFAIQFDAKTHWDESGDHKLSSEGAARTMLEKRRTPASNSLLHDYLVQKMGIDEVRAKQIIHERMDEGRVQADKLKPQDIDFLKNSEFDGNPPQQSYIKYKQGKKIILPDCNGRMQEFTIGFNAEYKEFVKIYSKSGIEYKIKKGFVDKYNKPELSDMMYTVGDMFGRVVDKITWNTTLAITIINMRGDLYPAMIQGKLRWMLKPQAWRVTMDPRQDEAENYFGDENKYNRVYEDLEKQGKKYILDEDLPTGAPSVQLQVGGLQMLNHHRLMGARHVPIEVKLTNFSTFN